MIFDTVKLKNKKTINTARLTEKENSRFYKKAYRQIYTQFLHYLFWKEIAIIWYLNNYNNNIWWIIIFIFYFCFIDFSFIFCLLFKFNNFCIILCSVFQNQFYQHIWLISLFAMKCCGLPFLYLCGGAELPCRLS